MRVLLIAVLTLGWTHGATLWNQTNERDFMGHPVYVAGPCTFHIKNDIDQTMFFENDKVLQPNHGIVTVKENAEIVVTCSENSNIRVKVTCVGGQIFRNSNGKTINIEKLTCTTKPVKKAGNCLNTKSLIGIGFNNGNSIIEQMEVCFDEINKQTLYVKMTMPKGISDDHSQAVCRSDFRKDGTFITESLKNLYDKHQKTFDLVLGKHLVEKVSEGHLVAWADFPYSLQRRLTMFYLNTAPQWRSFNEGNWNALEQMIRSTAKSNDYDVYTGTYGVLELQDINGNYVEMYLSPANANNPTSEYPVPKYFWKVLIEKTKNWNQKAKGIAFIGRNNVMDKLTTSESTICENEIELKTIAWLKGHQDWENIQKGRIIACEVEDFKTLWGRHPPNFPPVTDFPMNNL